MFSVVFAVSRHFSSLMNPQIENSSMAPYTKENILYKLYGHRTINSSNKTASFEVLSTID